MKLLLVEDNLSLQTTLVRTLSRQGYVVDVCADGREVLARWRSVQPDLVLLDLSLPGKDGLTVLGEARQQGLRAPVLILTARGTVGDRILGLNTGADDYLPKPFDLDELEARIKALLRRFPAQPGHAAVVPASLAALGESVRAPGPAGGAVGVAFDVDRESGAVYHHGQAMDLPPRELALLRALLARPGQAMTKERLFDQVFPGELEVQPEAIEVVAYRLRKRLAGTEAQLITLRGLGYLLKLQGAPA